MELNVNSKNNHKNSNKVITTSVLKTFLSVLQLWSDKDLAQAVPFKTLSFLQVPNYMSKFKINYIFDIQKKKENIRTSIVSEI